MAALKPYYGETEKAFTVHTFVQSRHAAFLINFITSPHSLAEHIKTTSWQFSFQIIQVPLRMSHLEAVLGWEWWECPTCWLACSQRMRQLPLGS